MSEMVERVARALYDVCSVEGVTTPWEKVRKGIRELHIEEARAAIEAMRSPTFDVEQVSYHQGMSRRDWWGSMISAALQD